MLAYKKTLLENTILRSEALSFLKSGFILKEQKELIDKELPAYRKHNVLVRIGFFILGCLLYSSSCSMFALITAVSGSEHYTWTFFVYAAFGFFALEFVIRTWNYYGNGLDDAFLFCAQVCLLTAIGFLVDDMHMLAPLFLMAFIIGTICCIRYVDQFSALLACLGITAFVARLFLEAGALGRSLLPFILMILAFCIYRMFLWLRKRTHETAIYTNCLNLVFAFSLLLFYTSGNYFVVREATLELMDIHLSPGQDIPLAFIFYGLTFIIPSGYIYFGLVKKNRLVLWIGLLTFALSVFSIRYYYYFMPAEIALMLAGSLIFGIAFYAMHKLKAKSQGITYEQDKFTDTNTMLNIEALALLQRYAVKPESGQDSGVEFGGGEFGGGGSGNKF